MAEGSGGANASGQAGQGGEGSVSQGEGQVAQAAEGSLETGEESSEISGDDYSDDQTGEESTNEGSEESQEEQKVSKLFEQAKTWFPDQEFENEDELHDHLINNYNELSDYKKRNLEASNKVLEVLKTNPELGEVIKDVSKGMSFPQALARNVDLSNIEPIEGDPDYEAFAKARDERVAKMKESEEYQQKVEQNQEESKKAIKEFYDSKKMDETQAKEFADFVDGIYSKMSQGIIDSEVLNLFDNAKNFEARIEEAKKLASISSKNEAIDLKKKDTPKGDGMPRVGQGQKVPEKTKEKGILDDVFDMVAKKNQIYK